MDLPYRLLRPLLFRLPAEQAHQIAAHALGTAMSMGPARTAARALLRVDAPALRVRRWGIDFPNPVGLAAGFDKSGDSFNALGALGFGFVEIGTVTAVAQPGNPPPRLFRLPRDRALLNRLGFNNPGAAALADRLRSATIEPILGINIGKSKVTPIEAATEDYLQSLEHLERFARYLVVNVSSPNTPGLRELQDARPLRALLRALRRRADELARERSAAAAPILLKIAPDLSDSQIDEAVDIAGEEGAAGIVATNTTISRSGLCTPADRVEALGAGGISGAPLRARATAVVARVYARTSGALPVIGVGGIFSAEDAWERIRAGASLIQLYTGFVYGGPTVVRDINRGLAERLDKEGLRSVEEAVGMGAG
ncbi:MAG: quinone-dependent dihydroorotate dehydrogenase [Gemmatimonadetes bacterium]|nr:quinone-dependent dihydroorotate dehydrogenase [Gemmatimonadota bacterium]